MDENDKNEILRLVNLRQATKADAKSLEIMLRKYVDSKASVCQKCPTQIIFAQTRLRNWANTQSLEGIKEVPQKTKGGCQGCKNKPGRPKKI